MLSDRGSPESPSLQPVRDTQAAHLSAVLPPGHSAGPRDPPRAEDRLWAPELGVLKTSDRFARSLFLTRETKTQEGMNLLEEPQ